MFWVQTPCASLPWSKLVYLCARRQEKGADPLLSPDDDQIQQPNWGFCEKTLASDIFNNKFI